MEFLSPTCTSQYQDICPPSHLPPTQPFQYAQLISIKLKKNNLKSSKEKKTVAYKGTSIRLSVGLLAETLSARREE